MVVEIVMTMRILNFSNNLPTTGAANVRQIAAIEKYRVKLPLLNPQRLGYRFDEDAIGIYDDSDAGEIQQTGPCNDPPSIENLSVILHM